jgi:integrase
VVPAKKSVREIRFQLCKDVRGDWFELPAFLRDRRAILSDLSIVLRKPRALKNRPQGFRRIRVHDLKHTFGRRLRSAGVSFEDRQDLLGHKSGRITTHYSQAELCNLIDAAETVCDTESRKTHATTWLRRKAE